MCRRTGCLAYTAQLIDQLKAKPFESMTIEGHVLHLTARVGVSHGLGDGTSWQTLMRHADAAMYSEKER